MASHGRTNVHVEHSQIPFLVYMLLATENFAMVVDGDSLAPELQDGDYILFMLYGKPKDRQGLV